MTKNELRVLDVQLIAIAKENKANIMTQPGILNPALNKTSRIKHAFAQFVSAQSFVSALFILNAARIIHTKLLKEIVGKNVIFYTVCKLLILQAFAASKID